MLSEATSMAENVDDDNISPWQPAYSASAGGRGTSGETRDYSAKPARGGAPGRGLPQRALPSFCRPRGAARGACRARLRNAGPGHARPDRPRHGRGIRALRSAVSAALSAHVRRSDHARVIPAAAAAWSLVHGLCHLILDGHFAQRDEDFVKRVLAVVRFAVGPQRSA